MASGIKDKVVYAGHNAADAVKKVGHKIAEGTGKAVEFVKRETCIIPR